MDQSSEERNVGQDSNTVATESMDESVSLTASTSTMLASPGRATLMMAVSQSLQSLDPLSLLKPVQQTIQCGGNDKDSSFPVYGNDIIVYPCEVDSSQKVASSKIKFSQVCKYDWEQRYYYGNLIASTTKYIAYVVGGKTQNEHVRVINHITSSRVLLKGFVGKVMCLAFGGPDDNHIACMDMMGNLRIFSISEGSQGLTSEMTLEVLREESQLTEYSFVSWAPYVAEETSDNENESELIVTITYMQKADVLNVNTIRNTLGNSCRLQDIKEGKQSVYTGHEEPITQFAISPNYEVLATGSLDGHVKMWKIDFESDAEPSCVHDWLPHEGEPVTALCFCDNLLSRDEEAPCWRFLITGAIFNSEVKVWCSVSWKCLQTVRFRPNSSSNTSTENNPYPRLKAVLDKSAALFILSDVRRQVLYVLQLHQDSQEGSAHFTSLTECTLAQPLLCFSVYQTRVIKRKAPDEEMEGINGDAEEEDGDNNDGDDNGLDEEVPDDGTSDALSSARSNAYQVSLKMFGIHVKSVDKLHIKFTPAFSVAPAAPSECTALSSEDQISIRDGLSDITGEQGSVVSDQEDNDSFATAALKLSAVEESLKSDVSSLTSVTQSSSSVAQGADAPEERSQMDTSESGEQQAETEVVSGHASGEDEGREERDSVSPEEEQRGSIKQDSGTLELPALTALTDEELEENKKDSSGSIQEETSTKSSSLPVDTEITKPRRGIITIPGRSKDIDAEKSAYFNELARRQLLEDLGLEQLGRSASPKSAQKSKGRLLKNGGNGKVGNVSRPESSSTIRTGDLLGLGVNGEASFDKGKSSTPENSQQMEAILKMLQDQERTMTQMSRSLQQLTATVEQQRKQIDVTQQMLKRDRAHMQQAQKSSVPDFNNAMKEFRKACSEQLDWLSAKLQTNLGQAQERQTVAMFQDLSSALTGKIDKSMKAEMKNSLMPNLQKPVNLAMEQMSSHVSTRFAAMEKVFRDEVDAMLKGKAVIDSLGFNAASVLESILPNAYRNVFESVLIPSFEQSCQQMFLQISKEFDKGTKSHFERMDSYFNSKKQKEQSRDQVSKQLQELSKTFQDTADRLTGIESNLVLVIETKITDLMKTLQKELVSYLDKSLNQLREEYHVMFGMASAKEMSDTVEDPRAQLKESIAVGDYNKAFSIALNAEDLDLVLHVCKNVDAEDVFSKKSNALTQPVILSLIQQLSVDIVGETDVKVNFLSEAIDALNPNDEITSEHMPRVLENLASQVSIASSQLRETDPNHGSLKQLKSLRQLVRATLKAASF